MKINLLKLNLFETNLNKINTNDKINADNDEIL